jgi:uncharacterized coiled-coil protein SlyX
MSLSRFIEQIEQLKTTASPLLATIGPYHGYLVTALRELDSLIGMKELKHMATLQVQFLMVRKWRESMGLTVGTDLFDRHELHTVISGSPGSGKTTVARILCKIWSALNILKKPSTPKAPSVPSLVGNEFTSNPVYKMQKLIIESLNNRCAELEGQLYESNRRFTDLSSTLADSQSRISNAQSQLSVVKGSLASVEDRSRVEDLSTLLRETQYRFDSIILSNLPADIYIPPAVSLTSPTASMGSPVAHGGAGSSSPITVETSTPTPPEIPFVEGNRCNLVAEYVGQTAPKAMKVLNSALGGVLFLDEAYQFGTDQFGTEFLNLLNTFMSDHSGEIIVIMAGYTDDIEKRVYSVQKGLKRRFGWTFEMSEYSWEELSKIFLYQLQQGQWSIEKTPKLEEFFRRNRQHFKHSGGDTNFLAYHAKLAYSEIVFKALTKGEDPPKELTLEMLETAMVALKKKNEEKSPNPYTGMPYHV